MVGVGGFLADLNDPWLKPRLLKPLVAERLPQPGGAELPPAEVASVLRAVRTHDLLSENLRGHPPDSKLAEAWRAAVDAWVERLGALVESDLVYCRWLGTCFLGVTFQECSNERFAESYSSWFEKILCNLQGPSTLQLITSISCTSMSDLFVRSAMFINLKKEASSFAGRIVEPVLQLLNENAPVADEAIDLLRTVIKLYPSSVNRHYSKVESCIVAMVLNTKVNDKLSEKFARALALLPSVRVSEDSWSIMFRKILITVNNLLNDAFLGLEEEKKGHDIMMLLIPPGTDPPPTLGHELRSGGSVHVTKKFRLCTVPTISALIHCCDAMLTSYYPVQVNVPVRALIALIRRVLLVSGSLHNKMFPSTTSLHQELICFELPSLHSAFLDLLIATIKGMRSHLLPHAASIIRLMTEYFKVAKLPTMRTKVYSIAQLLLISMGAGTSLHLLETVVSNAVADLSDVNENGMTMFSINPSKVTTESASKGFSKKRKHDPDMQNSVFSASEKATTSPRKKKSSVPVVSKEMASESITDGRMFTPFSVRIAALETLEILLNVGGSFQTGHWRSEVDFLLINVARSVFATGGGYEQRSSKVGEPSISDLQLASLKVLLTSFLSSPHARPPYLAQGMELFRKGKLEIGTKLAEFCSHALLALDVLTHPRALSLERAAPLGPGLNYGAPEAAVFGAGQYKQSSSGVLPQAMEVEDMYDDWLESKDDEPIEASLNGGVIGINTAAAGPNHGSQLTHVTEDPKIDPPRVTDAVQVQVSNKSDAQMVDAATGESIKLNTVDDPSGTDAVVTPVCTSNSDSHNQVIASFPEQKPTYGISHLENKSLAVDTSSSKPTASDEVSAVPGVASSSHQAPRGSSNTFAELFGSDSDSDSEDSLPEIQDGDPDSD